MIHAIEKTKSPARIFFLALCIGAFQFPSAFAQKTESVEWDFAEHFATGPGQAGQEIVLRADAAEGVTLHGAGPNDMKSSKLGPGKYLLLNARNEEGDGTRGVTFEPTLPGEGWYEVWLQMPKMYWPATAKGMEVKIHHADGETSLDARPRLSGIWVFFGTYRFSATGARVSINNAGVFSLAGIEAVGFVPTTKPAQKRGPRPVPPAQDDFDRMRDHWLDVLTGPPNMDETDPEVRKLFLERDFLAHLLWVSMNKASGRNKLWEDMNHLTNDYHARGGEMTESFNRLRWLALAYVGAAPHHGYGAKMRGNPKLKNDIIEAFDWLMKTSWNENTESKPLGWLNQKSFIPRYGSEFLLALDGSVPASMKERFLSTALRLSPTPMENTGANRLFLVVAHTTMGMAGKDAARIELAREAMNEPMSYAQRSGDGAKVDGLYVDGSFIQHGNIPYNHGYGTTMVKLLTEVIGLFEGSPWQVPDDQKKVLVDYIWNGVVPLSWRGQWFRRVTGRAVSSVKDELPTIESNLLSAMSIAPPADRRKMAEILKAIAEDPDFRAYREEKEKSVTKRFGTKLPQFVIARDALLLEVTNDPTLKPQPWWIGARVFCNMDMASAVRRNFAAELSMSSTRIATNESFYQNNKHGWYQGDGHLMLHTLDFRKFLHEYWPTHNPYRLPGTTVDTQPRPDGGPGAANTGKTSSSDFAGGAHVGEGGLMAVAGMELHAQDSTLKARKAWFFFDDEIVCLGSAITSSDARTIETIVEQAKINEAGDNRLIIDGKPMPVGLGWTQAVSGPKWINLTGNVAGADTGYFFPQSAEVNVLRESRTGAWTDIGNPGKNDPTKFTRNYVTMWFDHGSNPENAAYQYVLLPGMTAAQTQAYAQSPDIEVLANTPQVSAAREKKLNVTAAIFFEDGPASAGIISSDRKAAVIVWETPQEIRVSISDPTQKNEGEVTVTVDLRGRAPAKTDPEVKATVTGNKLQLVVDMNASDGKTFETIFPR